MRAFVQMFVLAPESPKKYYVRSDFFRYQDDDFVSESETNEEPGDPFFRVSTGTGAVMCPGLPTLFYY